MLQKKFVFENEKKRKTINDVLKQNSLENIYVGETFPKNLIAILSKKYSIRM